MRTKSASNIKTLDIDTLFGVNEPEPTQDVSPVVDLPLEQLVAFKGHPFKVDNKTHIKRLSDSISINGVLTPIIVRPIDKERYEIVSGHCRKIACEGLGHTTIPAIIKDMSTDDAIIAMVDSNINRIHLLPSEKAKAYRMKYDAMKHQGYNTNPKGLTLEQLSKESGDNPKKIQRFIRLSYLIDDLLDMLDKNRIRMSAAYHLAFLTKEEQKIVAKEIAELDELKRWQAEKLKYISRDNNFNIDAVHEILWNENLDDVDENKQNKPKNDKVLTFPPEVISKYFPEDTTEDTIRQTIISLLDGWKKGGVAG